MLPLLSVDFPGLYSGRVAVSRNARSLETSVSNDAETFNRRAIKTRAGHDSSSNRPSGERICQREETFSLSRVIAVRQIYIFRHNPLSSSPTPFSQIFVKIFKKIIKKLKDYFYKRKRLSKISRIDARKLHFTRKLSREKNSSSSRHYDWFSSRR